MAMDKVAELIAVAKTLSLHERRRLVVELDALDAGEGREPAAAADPLAALRALAGTVHSDFDDLSSDKYTHVAAASRESDGWGMQRVFVDTGGFVGLLVAEDRMHVRARELFDAASRDHWTLVATNAVVVETYSVLLARARDGRRAAIAFLDAVDASSGALTVERILVEDESTAAALVRAHTDKLYSLCDALSFVVMGRLGVTEAISFDRHFREYGRFTIL
jgi:uncharacterized protein